MRRWRRWWRIKRLFEKRLTLLNSNAQELDKTVTLSVDVVLTRALVLDCPNSEPLANLLADEVRGQVKRALMRSLPA